MHRYAIVLACCTLLLVVAGGNVTSKDAGLSVPDWPLSYGRFMPEGWFEIDNVRAEHGHRMIAGAVGLMTAALLAWTLMREKRRWVKVMAAVTAAAVIVQAVVGGISVLLSRYLPMTVVHALLGQTFFCLTILMALFTSPSWSASARLQPLESPAGGRLRLVCVALVAAVSLQLLMGALMRHTNSGTAIVDFPLAYGRVIPPLDEAGIKKINLDRLYIDSPEVLLPVTAPMILIHYLHRLGALMVLAAAGWMHMVVMRNFPKLTALTIPAMIIASLLIMQIMLGIWTVLSFNQPWVTTAHVATGALILGCSVFLSAQAFRYVRPAPGGVAAAAALDPEESAA